MLLFPILTEYGVQVYITILPFVEYFLAECTLKQHAAFLHDPAAGWIVHVMHGLYAIEFQRIECVVNYA